MGKESPGTRDGTGPYAGSYQAQVSPGIGRRQAAGESCPARPDAPAPQPPPKAPAVTS